MQSAELRAKDGRDERGVMKRDMDLIRQLMLQVESSQEPSSIQLIPEGASDEEAERIIEHLRMLVDDVEFLTGIPAHTLAGNNWLDLKLTWEGHDFLDSVRDPEIWKKTKTGAMAAGGFTVDLLKDLAKGLIKKQIEDRTGVKL